MPDVVITVICAPDDGWSYYPKHVELAVHRNIINCIIVASALKWMPKQKRARGRPKKKWMEGIRKAMNERNPKEGQWEDRKQ